MDLAAILIASLVALGVAAQARSIPLGVSATVGFFAVCAVGGYTDNWTWTGIGPASHNAGQGKTLWDTLQLLILPAILAFGGIWFNNQQSAAAENENQIRAQNQILNAYVGQISDLMLSHNLTSTSTSWSEQSAIARARTLAALSQLDPVRDAIAVRFLIESHLIPAVSLSIVNMQGVSLRGVDLSHADLKWAWLNRHADLSFANLTGAGLIQAHLDTANLSWAHLSHANLSYADLSDANLSHADLYCDYTSSAPHPSPNSSCNPARAALTANVFGVRWNDTVCPDGTLSDHNGSKPQSCYGHLRP